MLGLRWCDIDLDAKTLKVVQARVIAEGQVIIEEPKSHNGKRTLSLDAALVDALKALKARQAAEKPASGQAYQASGSGRSVTIFPSPSGCSAVPQQPG